MKEIEWARLTEPFEAGDVEWRIGRSGEKNGKIWATCLAYLTARAIQERLDEVFGPGGWKNEYRPGPDGGVVCRIYFRNDEGDWVWREDGAENTDIEGVKGGLSGSLKRAGAALGIGRYLYQLDEGFANIHDRGANYAKLKSGQGFKWDPPELPKFAQPGGGPPPARAAAPAPAQSHEEVDTETGEIVEDEDLALIKARTLELINKVRADQTAMKLMKPGVLTSAENLLSGSNMSRIVAAGNHLADVLHEASEAGVR